ncbi:MAG: type IX secretion system protein PorQ [Bacteroidia bacterium]
MKYLAVFTLIICYASSYAQIGGSSAFTFSLVENSARHTALGGYSITNTDSDPAAGYQNPALINTSMHNSASLSYANQVADLKYGFASYSKTWDDLGSFLFTIGYFDYGKFVRTNNAGDILGEFTADDYNFQVGYSRKFNDKIQYGTNFKFLYSVYEAYVSTAGAFDFGGSYIDTANLLTAGVLIKNLGYQFIRYGDDSPREPLPFDIQASISKKLEHNPLRFTLTLHNLHRWNNSYVNVNARNKEIDLETGVVKNQELGFGEKMMRHVVFNTEFVFSDRFQLRTGYNHQRRAELGPENRRAMTGFSWGLGIGVRKLKIGYGSAGYFPGIASNYFSVSRDLSRFTKKK